MSQNMHGRKNIRLKNYDYKSNGYYFITVVTKLRKNILLNKEKLVEKKIK